jgi:hypothetical protein
VFVLLAVEVEKAISIDFIQAEEEEEYEERCEHKGFILEKEFTKIIGELRWGLICILHR